MRQRLLSAAALIIAATASAHATPLSPQHKAILVQSMSASCAQALQARPENAAMQQKLGADYATRYCGCTAEHTSTAVSTEDVAAIAQNKGAMPAHVQARMSEGAKLCMQQLTKGRTL